MRKSVGGPAELARQNFSTAGYAHRFACAPSGPCPARVCKPSRSPRRRGAACLSARICVPRRSHKTVLYFFERWGQISQLPNSARTIFEPIHGSRGVDKKHSVDLFDVCSESVRLQRLRRDTSPASPRSANAPGPGTTVYVKNAPATLGFPHPVVASTLRLK